jgi:hypothetical protein
MQLTLPLVPRFGAGVRSAWPMGAVGAQPPGPEVGGDGVRSGGGAVRAEVAAARGGRVVGVAGERSEGVAEVAQASTVEA